MHAPTLSSEEELSHAYREAALLLSAGSPLLRLLMATGRALGLDSEQLCRLELGGLLHDVGKQEIPQEILHKSGPLEPHERALIEQHTVVGQMMLDKAGGLLGEVGLVVRSSHERYDGLGYPDGLAGQAIPIESRIIACCDAFNAMTTDRPYRTAVPLDEALHRLRKNSETQFDPTVVEALMAVMGSKRS